VSDDQEPEPAANPEPSKSEKFEIIWTPTFVDKTTIEAGEMIVPSKISGPLADEYADLHMIAGDFAFALEALMEAAKHGPPDVTNVHARALIFAAVVAYARPFSSSVRSIKLSPEYFAQIPAFDEELHDYLFVLRSTHVAHSVNEFENANATGVMVGNPPDHLWRVAGIGVTQLQIIGLTLRHVEAAIAHTGAMLAHINARIQEIKPLLFEEVRAEFAAKRQFQMAPLGTLPDRSKVGKRRKPR
jgi:hypothetical protein